ncbi:CAMK/CAMK1 protein kinase [Spizellomyces punctatus DAOM BR117]|uniref:CAMK/CAMK1 protein kinase n=1 Tax=Spizellomyces punctatus (strain DAOM BR117) TaxID=645134 RepID=A0A0L0HPE5_SPIPD|nr:CAMK/CAMK1 protein kinase [Spizellomyces punctatus DAOM BR117]KND03276.1 CAMK/CAMK1 protein kinase [Spizellomyces punctatus DAOM BR117]|eukprot:XP_016611315.1 CAMK/CAMK1 protein kinase [Spizellomyces punctatus DAOM BR117]
MKKFLAKIIGKGKHEHVLPGDNAESAFAAPTKSGSLVQPRSSNSGKIQSAFDEHYFMGKQLGIGSFAVVKECTRKSDSAKFAVKIIDKAQLRGKLEMLRMEVDVLKRINHPNVIGLCDIHETGTHVYLVTQLATGGELFDRIFTKGSYTEKDASALVRQLLTAIAYLHDMDIVHRDLKPENLLFKDQAEDSELMIADFGLSKMVEEGSFLQTACGTPHYVAPEILQQKGHGKPVDMWAIGVITYVLLCGYTPFWAEDNSNTSLFRAILECDYQFDEEYWAEISDAAKDFIRKLLVSDPTRRATAKDALTHPWLETESRVDLMPMVVKNFNARKTFKKAVLAVNTINRVAKASNSMRNLMSSQQGAASHPTGNIKEALPAASEAVTA